MVPDIGHLGISWDVLGGHLRLGTWAVVYTKDRTSWDVLGDPGTFETRDMQGRIAKLGYPGISRDVLGDPGTFETWDKQGRMTIGWDILGHPQILIMIR